MGKTNVAPSTFDAFSTHPVMLALSKAHAIAWTLGELGDPNGTDLSHALRDAETHGWIHSAIVEALTAALTEAERAFRKSLTPDEARRQALGGTAPDPANPPRLHAVARNRKSGTTVA